MSQAFQAALKEVLHHEGGYSNHSRDPGGITNLGVTLKAWETWTGNRADEAQMRALTPAKVTPLYRSSYWDALRCDEMHPALALCVFDFGVNAGISRSARYLQKLVGASADGKIGPATLQAVKDYITAHGPAEAVRAFQQQRRAYYRQLGTFDAFGRGWLRRVDSVETAALRMVK